MKKTSCVALLIVFLACSLIIIENVNVVRGATVPSNISSDTIWTAANSPYNFEGAVQVANGVTLTIEAGTVVNLNGYNLNVEGTLLAQGNSNTKITFNSATNGVTIGGTSTISNCRIYGRIIVVDGSAIISDNTVEAIPPEGADNLSGNITHGYIAADNVAVDEQNIGIFIKGTVDDALISNNTISGGAEGIKVQADGSVTIQGNTIQENIVNGIEITSTAHVRITSNYFSHNIGRAIVDQGEAYLVIRNNTIKYEPADMRQGIYNSIFGIELHGNRNNPLIIGNHISGCIVGIGNGAGTIERNLFTKNNGAIDLAFGLSCIVQNNTIINNSRGISAPSSATTIKYNNIIDSFETGSIWMTNPSSDVDATYNYWGTTDNQAIAQGILTNDFGNVRFVPFLTESNPQAMPDNMTITTTASSNAPTIVPTAEPTQTSKSTATVTQNPTIQPDESSSVTQIFIFGWSSAEIAIITLLSVIAVLLVFVVFYLRKKQKLTDFAS